MWIYEGVTTRYTIRNNNKPGSMAKGEIVCALYQKSTKRFFVVFC